MTIYADICKEAIFERFSGTAEQRWKISNCWTQYNEFAI